MTHETADVVVELFTRVWTRRDLAAAMELVHADAEFDWSGSRSPYRGFYRGHDALREAAEAIWDAWDEWEPRFEEVIEIDPETILIVTHVRARGKGSGIPVEAHGASIWSVRDGKIARAKLFQSKTEALDALDRDAA